MVGYKNERRVYLWHVTARPSPPEAPVSITMDEVLEVFRRNYDADSATVYVSDDGSVIDRANSSAAYDPKNRVFIADISEREDGFITFLISRGDPTAANPAFINGESKVRDISPRKDEAQGWSAHIVVSKTGTNGIHRACCERMPNVATSYIDTLFRHLLEGYASNNPKFFYEKRTKRGKKYITTTEHCKPRFHVARVPSETLKNDLKRGELATITLIDSDYKFSGSDAPSRVKSVKSKLIIRPMPIESSKIADYIKQITPWAKEKGYDEIQIGIEKLPGNSRTSPRFKLDQEDATESLYVRSQRITDFKSSLSRCYDKVCDEIEAKMVAILKDKSKW